MSTYRTREFHQLAQFHWKYFKAMMNHLMDQEFGGVIPDKDTIEIVRIDFCFNMVFNSAGDVSNYLQFLKRVRKKYFRDSTRVITNYFSGIHYPAGSHTLKIYHKGPEFKASHKGTPSNYARTKKRFGQDVADQILERAYKVLRYEVSFKSSTFSDIWKRRLSCPYFQKAVRRATKIQTHGYLTIEGNKVEYVDLPQTVKKSIKVGKWLDNRDVKFFMLASKDQDFDYDTHQQFDFKATFTFDVFEKLLQKFHNIMKDFVVGDSTSLLLVQRELDKNKVFDSLTKKGVLNDKRFKGIDMGKVRILYDMIREGSSWSDIKQSGYLSRPSFYRYKKFFKDMGLSEVNADHGFNVSLTYNNYYDLVTDIFSTCVPKTKYPFRI